MKAASHVKVKYKVRVKPLININWGSWNYLNVFIDDQKVGSIKYGDGAEEMISIKPGHHVICVGAFGVKTKDIELDLSAGKTRTFECGVVRQSRSLMLLFGILVATVLVAFILKSYGLISYNVYMGFDGIFWFAMLGINLDRQFRRGALYYLKQTHKDS